MTAVFAEGKDQEKLKRFRDEDSIVFSFMLPQVQRQRCGEMKFEDAKSSAFESDSFLDLLSDLASGDVTVEGPGFSSQLHALFDESDDQDITDNLPDESKNMKEYQKEQFNHTFDVMRSRSITAPPEFRIVSLLGHGGFGDVFEVEIIQSSHGTTQSILGAMKCFNGSDELAGQKAVITLAREIRKLGELRETNGMTHPNIIQPLYATCNPNILKGVALIMERAHYGSMKHVIKSFKPPETNSKAPFELSANWIPLAISFKWLRQLASALVFIHNKGISHNDIKPDNIMIREDFSIALADFGASKSETSVPPWEVTTLIYGCPLRREHKAKGPLCDMYSFGVTAFTLLTQQEPLKRMRDSDKCTSIYQSYFKSRIQEQRLENDVLLMNSLLSEIILPTMKVVEVDSHSAVVDLTNIRKSSVQILYDLDEIRVSLKVSVSNDDKDYLESICKRLEGKKV